MRSIELALGPACVLTSLIMLAVYLVLGDVPPTVRLEADVGDARVTLSWRVGAADGRDVDGWELWVEKGRGRESGGQWAAMDPAVRDETGAREHVVEPLENGRRYVFRVRARKGDVVGRPSNQASAIPRGEPRTPGDQDGPGDLAGLFCAGQRGLGEVRFAFDSAEIDCDGGEVRQIVTKLQGEAVRGVVVVEGHATVPGGVLHNLDLSERRAVAVIDCLEDSLADTEGRLAFREIARGESYRVVDPNGQSPKTGRVAEAVLCSVPESASGAE